MNHFNIIQNDMGVEERNGPLRQVFVNQQPLTPDGLADECTEQLAEYTQALEWSNQRQRDGAQGDEVPGGPRRTFRQNRFSAKIGRSQRGGFADVMAAGGHIVTTPESREADMAFEMRPSMVGPARIAQAKAMSPGARETQKEFRNLMLRKGLVSKKSEQATGPTRSLFTHKKDQALGQGQLVSEPNSAKPKTLVSRMLTQNQQRKVVREM